jgi:phage tail-like protein
MTFRPPILHIDNIQQIAVPNPIIFNRQPYPNQIGVSVSSIIQFTVGFFQNPGLVTLTDLDATVNGVPALLAMNILVPFRGARASTNWLTNQIYQVTLDAGVLPSYSDFEVVVHAEWDNGQILDETYYFQTQDLRQPKLAEVIAIDRRTIRATFSQDVVSGSNSVSCLFPWGLETLIADGNSWTFLVSYPWVKAQTFGGYFLSAGTFLDLKIDGNQYRIIVPIDTTDAITTAAALDPILSALGGGCREAGGFIWLWNQNATGTIEILSGGANGRLNCEAGEFSARLAYGTIEGIYSLTLTALQPDGQIVSRTISALLTQSNPTYVVQDFVEVFDSSILNASNYALTYDATLVVQEMNPTHIPIVLSVALVEPNIVDLTLETLMTQNGPYILSVSNIFDAEGNEIDPEFSTISFRGYIPEIPEKTSRNIYKWFPEFNRRQDTDNNLFLLKISNVLQEVLNQIFSDLDAFKSLHDITTANTRSIDNLLENYGNPFVWFSLSVIEKRQLLRILVDLYKLKGTAIGIEAALRFFFDFTTITFQYYWGTGWLMSIPGRTELGLTTILNSSLLRDRYSFSIIIDRVLTDEEKELFRRVVDTMKTAHTHFIDIIEPSSPFVPDHWQIPWSELGINTILH